MNKSKGYLSAAKPPPRSGPPRPIVEAGGLSEVPRECLFDYSGMCWWCGGPANSREHKWKRSELTDLFGQQEYGRNVAWIHDGRVDTLRGPKADGAKFGKTLCANCNGNRSQSFDHAYDRWSKFLIRNHSQIMERRRIDFRGIFGTDSLAALPNLARYYGKHIGCRIAEGAGKVPPDLIEFLDGTTMNAASVFSHLGIRVAMQPIAKPGRMGVYLRDSVARYDTSRRMLTSFKSGIGLGAIEFCYDANLDPLRENTGSGILGDVIQVLEFHGEDIYALQMERFVAGRGPSHRAIAGTG